MSILNTYTTLYVCYTTYHLIFIPRYMYVTTLNAYTTYHLINLNTYITLYVCYTTYHLINLTHQVCQFLIHIPHYMYVTTLNAYTTYHLINFTHQVCQFYTTYHLINLNTYTTLYVCYNSECIYYLSSHKSEYIYHTICMLH